MSGGGDDEEEEECGREKEGLSHGIGEWGRRVALWRDF